MPSHFRKLLLTLHIATSVGWLGAILPYLVFAVRGTSSHDLQTQQAAFNALVIIGDKALIPLSFAALATGLILSLATRWGLVRYWWVVAKLALTVFSAAVLYRHMHLVHRTALLLQSGVGTTSAMREFIVHPTGGLIVLLLVTAISVFKPWGLTSWGRRSQSLSSPAYAPPRHLVAMRDSRTQNPLLFWMGTGAHVVGLAIVLHVAFRIAGVSEPLHHIH